MFGSLLFTLALTVPAHAEEEVEAPALAVVGDGEAVGGEASLPRLHETRFADGGAGLFLGDLFRFFEETERTHAEADGTGGDDDDFRAPGTERGDLSADGGDARGIELANTGGEDTGAEFDDDALGRGGGGCDELGHRGHGGCWESTEAGANAGGEIAGQMAEPMPCIVAHL